MKKLLYVIIFIVLSAVAAHLLIQQPNQADERTKLLCRQYADRDHEKELSPDRWQWFKNEGVDLNKDFDWYQSCINHNTKAVAD